MKKKLQKLRAEPWLLIAIPFSFITLALIIALRPIIRIRIGFLRSERIGHFAANTEIYLCERDVNKGDRTTIDLVYFTRKVCNQQLATMWSRRLLVLPWFWLRPLDLIIRSFAILSCYHAFEGKGGDRDINNLLDKIPSHLQFTNDEEKRGKAGLSAMGVKGDARFVCMTVRDSAYLSDLYHGADTHYHNYRDSDIQNYVSAVEALANRGYYVIRMGAKVSATLNSSNPKVIDYAANGMRTDFMDIYLGAKCEFCISTSTGFDAIPLIFRRPIVYVNMVPLGWVFTFSSKFLAITKHHFSVSKNRELTLREIFEDEVGFCMDTNGYESGGVQLIQNSPEEICSVVLEMADRVEGIWQPHAEDETLQKRFWRIFPSDAKDTRNVSLHGEIRSHFGTEFLRRNEGWLM